MITNIMATIIAGLVTNATVRYNIIYPSHSILCVENLTVMSGANNMSYLCPYQEEASPEEATEKWVTTIITEIRKLQFPFEGKDYEVVVGSKEISNRTKHYKKQENWKLESEQDTPINKWHNANIANIDIIGRQTNTVSIITNDVRFIDGTIEMKNEWMLFPLTLEQLRPLFDKYFEEKEGNLPSDEVTITGEIIMWPLEGEEKPTNKEEQAETRSGLTRTNKEELPQMTNSQLILGTGTAVCITSEELPRMTDTQFLVGSGETGVETRLLRQLDLIRNIRIMKTTIWVLGGILLICLILKRRIIVK